jgi:FSR family fosmidomycin resistance protein-like MFS transporter
MALTGSGLIAFLALGHTATDTATSMLAALLPLLQQRFGLSPMSLALLVATLSFSASLMQPVFGGLADRLGRRLVAGLSVIFSAVLLSLLGVVPAVWLLVGLLLLGGLGTAAYHPAGVSMARAAGGSHAGLAVSLFSAGGTLGFALGPLIALSFVATLGLGSTPWLMIPGIVLGVLMMFLIPPQQQTPSQPRPGVLDARVVAGPVGLLSLSEICSSLAFVTFTNAMPLWLVTGHGVSRDDALLGWTLAAFSLAAALGGVVAAALSARVSRRLLVVGSMSLAPLPLLATYHVEPGTPTFFLAIILAGALVNASLPLKLVAAQDLVPESSAMASGMLMGFATGTAGVLYVGIGWLQEVIGPAAAIGLAYSLPLPGALVAYSGLRERHAGRNSDQRARAATVMSAWGLCRDIFCAAGLTADPGQSQADEQDNSEHEATRTCSTPNHLRRSTMPQSLMDSKAA